jgi:AraC-like DNA-binding protein
MNSDILSAVAAIGSIHSVMRVHDRRTRAAHTAARHSDAFIYVLQGSGILTLSGGNAVTISKGDLVYLPKGLCYSFCPATADYEPIFCNFEFAEELQRQPVFTKPKDDAQTEKLFRTLHGVFRDTPAALCESMALLYRIYGQLWPEEKSAYLPTSAADNVLAAREYLQKNCHDPALSIAKAAQKAGISEVYFRKLFHAHCGTSPAHWLTTARMEKAKTLLREPFLSLEECAKQCGFTSLSYFCRVFRQEVGITPSKYRKQA